MIGLVPKNVWQKFDLHQTINSTDYLTNYSAEIFGRTELGPSLICEILELNLCKHDASWSLRNESRNTNRCSH